MRQIKLLKDWKGHKAGDVLDVTGDMMRYQAGRLRRMGYAEEYDAPKPAARRKSKKRLEEVDNGTV